MASPPLASSHQLIHASDRLLRPNIIHEIFLLIVAKSIGITIVGKRQNRAGSIK